jgi:hypothetical protein
MRVHRLAVLCSVYAHILLWYKWWCYNLLVYWQRLMEDARQLFKCCPLRIPYA